MCDLLSSNCVAQSLYDRLISNCHAQAQKHVASIQDRREKGSPWPVGEKLSSNTKMESARIEADGRHCAGPELQRRRPRRCSAAVRLRAATRRREAMRHRGRGEARRRGGVRRAAARSVAAAGGVRHTTAKGKRGRKGRAAEKKETAAPINPDQWVHRGRVKTSW